MERLCNHLEQGPKVAPPIRDDAELTPGQRQQVSTDIAPPPFQRLIKP